MTAPHQPPTQAQGQAEADAALYRTTLQSLIEIGTHLAHDIQAARNANEITPIEAAEAFERVARATRRSVLLAARLADRPAEQPHKDPHAPRRALIRAVEDAINREPRAPTPEARQRLEHEFRERLDAPELAEDLAVRPVPEFIAEILNDMDLGRPSFSDPRHFRRRTPDAIRRLHALARGEAVPLPELAPPKAKPPQAKRTTANQRQPGPPEVPLGTMELLAALTRPASPPPPTG